MGWNPSRLRTQRTEQNVDETIEKKNEREGNDLAEGPCSRAEETISKKTERAQPYIQYNICLFQGVFVEYSRGGEVLNKTYMNHLTLLIPSP